MRVYDGSIIYIQITPLTNHMHSSIKFHQFSIEEKEYSLLESINVMVQCFILICAVSLHLTAS